MGQFGDNIKYDSNIILKHQMNTGNPLKNKTNYILARLDIFSAPNFTESNQFSPDVQRRNFSFNLIVYWTTPKKKKANSISWLQIWGYQPLEYNCLTSANETCGKRKISVGIGKPITRVSLRSAEIFKRMESSYKPNWNNFKSCFGICSAMIPGKGEHLG